MITRKQQIHEATLKIFRQLCPRFEGAVMAFPIVDSAPLLNIQYKDIAQSPASHLVVIHAREIYEAIRVQVEKEFLSEV